MKFASKGAERVYKALKKWGDFKIIAEKHVGERLLLDFYLPELALGFEIQGSQHSEFNGFFHSTKDAFRAQQERDLRKESLCNDQGILYIPLDYPDVMGSKDAHSLLEHILAAIGSARKEREKENITEEDW